MRKQIIQQDTRERAPDEQASWLDLENLAQVELSSEDAQHPIESALGMSTGSGWRAQQEGEQAIRVLFDTPRRISRIQLLFKEEERTRTQEFVLRWFRDGGDSWQEIVRQQYNFSPQAVTRELEDYAVDLGALTKLELRIVPDISGGDARASLARLRLA
jgi:hypothetical protein